MVLSIFWAGLIGSKCAQVSAKSKRKTCPPLAGVAEGRGWTALAQTTNTPQTQHHQLTAPTKPCLPAVPPGRTTDNEDSIMVILPLGSSSLGKIIEPIQRCLFGGRPPSQARGRAIRSYLRYRCYPCLLRSCRPVGLRALRSALN